MNFYEISRELKKPFEAHQIHWRVGATNKEKTQGIALAYIDARDVMDRLDEVVGPGNWKDEYAMNGSVVVCTLSIRAEIDSPNAGQVVGGLIGIDRGLGEWVSKSDGAGETAVEGEKGSISDAFKRVGVKWGIGRYLYRLGTQWEPIKAQGRSFVLVKDPKLPSHALPGHVPDNVIYMRAVSANAYSLSVVCTHIDKGLENIANNQEPDSNYSVAAEAWREIDKDSKKIIWKLAPTKGCFFTTIQKETLNNLSKYLEVNNGGSE